VIELVVADLAAPLAAGHVGERGVDRQPVHPGRQRRVTAEGVQAAEHPHEHVLGDLLGLDRTDDAVDQPEHAPLVLVVQRLHGPGLAAPAGLDQDGVVADRGRGAVRERTGTGDVAGGFGVRHGILWAGWTLRAGAGLPASAHRQTVASPRRVRVSM